MTKVKSGWAITAYEKPKQQFFFLCAVGSTFSSLKYEEEVSEEDVGVKMLLRILLESFNFRGPLVIPYYSFILELESISLSPSRIFLVLSFLERTSLPSILFTFFF